MSTFEFISILLLIANGVLVPVTLYYVTAGKAARTAGFAALATRLDHLDGCLDNLKIQVVGSGITRPEFEAKMIDLRKEMISESEKQNLARHDLANRTAILVDNSEERVTRRVERLESKVGA